MRREETYLATSTVPHTTVPLLLLHLRERAHPSSHPSGLVHTHPTSGLVHTHSPSGLVHPHAHPAALTHSHSHSHSTTTTHTHTLHLLRRLPLLLLLLWRRRAHPHPRQRLLHERSPRLRQGVHPTPRRKHRLLMTLLRYHTGLRLMHLDRMMGLEMWMGGVRCLALIRRWVLL